MLWNIWTKSLSVLCRWKFCVREMNTGFGQRDCIISLRGIGVSKIFPKHGPSNALWTESKFSWTFSFREMGCFWKHYDTFWRKNYLLIFLQKTHSAEAQKNWIWTGSKFHYAKSDVLQNRPSLLHFNMLLLTDVCIFGYFLLLNVWLDLITTILGKRGPFHMLRISIRYIATHAQSIMTVLLLSHETQDIKFWRNHLSASSPLQLLNRITDIVHNQEQLEAPYPVLFKYEIFYLHIGRHREKFGL